MLSRRSFLTAAGTTPPLAATAWGTPPARKKIAIIATVWTYLSHAQHMGDRFLVGYPRGGQWHKPEIDVVSLYVDQRPDGDLSAQRAATHGFTIYRSIAQALRCGGDELAVDAVVMIAEHGNYPQNEKGQILYPRFEFFEQVVQVFDQDKRAVPLYNDKHLFTAPRRPSAWSPNRSD